MQLHIFRGSGRIFGVSPHATGENLPPQGAPWVAFKTLELARSGPPAPGLNTGECLDDIGKHGFHITEAHVRITNRFIGSDHPPNT